MDPFPVPGSAVDSPTECTSGPASAQPPHQRARWGSLEKRSLEDCLASLSEFDAHHQGRVSSFDTQGKVTTTEVVLAVSHLTFSYNTADTLEDFLPTRSCSGQGTLHPPSDAGPEAVSQMVEEEEKGEVTAFDIPILPAGKELIVNILSTWGDRHYVGLNGVEVFTVTGERAEVAEVCACDVCV